MTPLVVVANLGGTRVPTGQIVKARAVLSLLRSVGRQVEVVDVAESRLSVLRVVTKTVRGWPVIVVLNRKGLWATLLTVHAVRTFTRRRTIVIVPVVGGWLPRFVARAPFRAIARIADMYLAETPRLVAELHAAGLPAVELVNFRQLEVDHRRARRQTSSPLRLCIAGRVREDKGVVLAASVVAGLRAAGIEATLDIWGPIEEEAALSAALRTEGVSYAGSYGSAEDALRVLSTYDMLLLPSWYEGECMPGVVIEGLFAGLPAVVSDFGDLPAVVIDGVTGYVCPLERFVTDAVERISRGLATGELTRLSRRALERAPMFTEGEARRVFLDVVSALEAGAK